MKAILPLLLVLCTSCASTTPAPPEAVEALRAHHVNALARTGCIGCPTTWTLQSCTFIEQLIQPGSGATAATCQVVSPRGSSRGLPEQIRGTAQQRVNEALADAETNPDKALRLYAFGADLQRLAHPDLWTLGQEAQARALDALASSAPPATWPADLIRMAEGGLPPVRVTDMVIVDALATRQDLTVADLEELRRASDLATDAIRASGGARETAIDAFTLEAKTPVDVAAVWRQGEALRTRALQVSLDASLKASLGKRGACPHSLDELTPDPLDRVPTGFTLDVATCTAKAATPPSG